MNRESGLPIRSMGIRDGTADAQCVQHEVVRADDVGSDSGLLDRGWCGVGTCIATGIG